MKKFLSTILILCTFIPTLVLADFSNYQNQITPLQTRLTALQNAQTLNTKMNGYASTIDQLKTKYGFTTVTYTNTGETTRLKAEEISFVQAQDRVAETLATPDGQVVAGINPYVAGTVLVVGGAVVCYLACPAGFVATIVTTVNGTVTLASTKVADIFAKFGTNVVNVANLALKAGKLVY